VLQVADDPVGLEPVRSRERQELRRHVHEPVTTQSNSRPANASRIESASPTSAMSGVTSCGSGRRAAERPRLMTETSIPLAYGLCDTGCADGACAAVVENIHAANSDPMGAAPVARLTERRAMVAAIPSSRIRLLLASAGPPVLSRMATRNWSPSAESACAARFGEFVVSRPFQDMIERGVPRLRALPVGAGGTGYAR
jgi:hypothetical protein